MFSGSKVCPPELYINRTVRHWSKTKAGVLLNHLFFFLQLHCLQLHLLQDLFHLLLANSHTLQFETIRSVIKQMRETFLKLHTVFGVNESLKLHVIFAHYVEYFELTWHALLRYIDEVTEAVHSQIRMFEERQKLKRNDKSSQLAMVMQMPSTHVWYFITLLLWETSK